MGKDLELTPDDRALAEKQLITLDPMAYTAAVYQPFRERLDLLKVEAPAVVYDIATTAGMELAKQWRAKCKAVRIDADKERENRKAPVLKIGRLLDSTYKEIEAAVLPLEDRFDRDIKEVEARKERERQEKIAAELARVQGIQERIQAIRDYATRASGIHSDRVADLSQELGEILTGPDFAEFQQQAKDAKDAALLALHKIYDDRLAHEREAERVKAEREELNRLRELQAAREALERARIAEEEAAAKARREAEEAQQRAQRQAEEAEAARLRKIEEARLAELAAALERQQLEFREQLAAAEAADKARQPAPLTASAAIPATALSQEPQQPAFVLTPPSAPERPSADEIVRVLAEHYERDRSVVIGWLMDLEF